MPPCNQKNPKSKDADYECNEKTGRWIKKKKNTVVKNKTVKTKTDKPVLSRKELLALPAAKNIKGRHKMRINELRALLLSDNNKSVGGRDCKNETDIMGDNTSDIPAERFFRTSNGYCHDIDVLVQYLLSSSIKNIDPNDPYNRDPIWTSEKERLAIWNHKGLDKGLKKDLVRLQKKVNEKTLTAVHYPMLEKIAEIGWIIWNDKPTSYADSGFEVSERMLVRLRALIEASPDPQTILQLRNGSDDRTLQQEIFETGHASCIHGKGTFLIKVYLFHYFNSFADKQDIHPLFAIIAPTRVISPLCMLPQISDILVTMFKTNIQPKEFYLNRNMNSFAFTWSASGNVFSITPEYDKVARSIFKKNKKKFIATALGVVVDHVK